MLRFFQGMQYVIKGVKQLLTPGLRRFVIIPIIFNCLVFAGLFYLGYYYLLSYAYYYVDKLPSWLSFLNGVLIVLFTIMFLLIFLGLFTVMFNVIAAPFNGLLAEKVQLQLYGRSVPSISFSRMALRAFKRQGQFLAYFLPRLLGMGLLFLIPFIHPIFPFAWFLFTAWMLSVQFQDIPMDNNLLSFQAMLQKVKSNTFRSLGFGSAVNLIGFIPFLNIVVMPAAVIGSTLLYCDNARAELE